MAEAKVKRSKNIFLFLRIAVASGALFWAFRDQDWSKLGQTLVGMNIGYFAVSLAIFTLCQAIIGLRWWILLRSQSIFIGLWAAVRLHFLGTFYNNCMPGSVGGDLVRAWYVTKHTNKKFEAALSVFVDRVIGLASTLVIALFFLFIFSVRSQTSTHRQSGATLKQIGQYKWIFFWIFAVLTVVFCSLLLHKRTRAVLVKVWSIIRVHGLNIVNRFKDAIVIYCRNPLAILTAFALTVFLQIATITGFWFLGVNMGLKASIKYYYVCFTLTWILGALPISIAGLGIVEGSLKELFKVLAGVVDLTPVSALALCQRAVWMIASLPGAAIHLLGAHLPGEAKSDKMQPEEAKDFFVDFEKRIN